MAEVGRISAVVGGVMWRILERLVAEQLAALHVAPTMVRYSPFMSARGTVVILGLLAFALLSSGCSEEDTYGFKPSPEEARYLSELVDLGVEVDLTPRDNGRLDLAALLWTREGRDACQTISIRAGFDAEFNADADATRIRVEDGWDAVVPELEARIPVYIAATRYICPDLNAVGRSWASAYERIIEDWPSR